MKYLKITYILFMILLLARTTPGAGVTILTHGFQSSEEDSLVWLNTMGRDIHDLWFAPLTDTPEDNFAFIRVNDHILFVSDTIEAWPTNLSSSSLGEVIVILNWSSAAGIIDPNGPDLAPAEEEEALITRTRIVAEAVIDLFTESQLGMPPLAELPIHIVGHSRGGSLASELARLFGEKGIWVDQVTLLDPHPVFLIDADARIYENVLFADNYWRQGAYPSGEHTLGAYNRFLVEDSLAIGGYSSSHSDVHLWYNGTIDNRYELDITDGEAILFSSMRSSWYVENELFGTMTGFRFSRFAETFLGSVRNTSFEPLRDGNSVNSGYNFLVGGNGSRYAIDKTSAIWPNLIDVDVIRNNDKLDAGEWYVTIGDTLQIQSKYVSYNTPWRVEYYLDDDLNPYNGFALFSPFLSGDGDSASYPGTLWGPFNTSGFPESDTSYFVCGKISSRTGNEVRYAYGKPRLVFVDPECCDFAGDMNNNGTVNITDVTYLIAWIFTGGPSPACCKEADANNNGAVNITDATYLIAWIFTGGPGPICGSVGDDSCH